MSIELDSKLRRELIRLLARVYALRDRKGRDVWLLKLPEIVQESIRQRSDNRGDDLTFIVDGVLGCNPNNGQWPILEAIHVLIEDLEGIEPAAGLEQIFVHIKEDLDRQTQPPGMSPPETPPPSPLDSHTVRQQWLTEFGFMTVAEPRPAVLDPFLYQYGGDDPFLTNYFDIKMKHFGAIRGEQDRPEPIIAFGPPGSGKSSIVNVISQLARKAGKGELTIIYRDFRALMEKHQRGERIDVIDHVEQILGTALKAIHEYFELIETMEKLEWPATPKHEIILNSLLLYVEEYEKEPLRRQSLKSTLNYLLKSVQLQSGESVVGAASIALPTNARDLLGRFCGYLRQTPICNFVSVLVDPNEEVNWQVLAPLLGGMDFQILAEQKIAFKFFLDQEMKSRALQDIRWVARDKDRRVYDLKWGVLELENLLRERLLGCHGTFVQLAQLTDGVYDVDERVIQLANGSPRRLIAIGNKLFDEHCYNWSRGGSLQITAEEVDTVLRGFEDQQPRSELEKLIAQHEHDRLEIKSTMRFNVMAGRYDKDMEHAIAKAMCGFLNSEGGTLVIGVDDKGVVIGLEKDFSTLGKRQDKDGFAQAFANLTTTMFDPTLTPENYSARFVEIDSKLVYVIDVRKRNEETFLKVGDDKKFYIRYQNSTRQLQGSDLTKYVRGHFPGS